MFRETRCFTHLLISTKRLLAAKSLICYATRETHRKMYSAITAVTLHPYYHCLFAEQALWKLEYEDHGGYRNRRPRSTRLVWYNFYISRSVSPSQTEAIGPRARYKADVHLKYSDRRQFALHETILNT